MVGCPSCGAELTFIADYQRHYCYDCRSYAPEPIHPCKTCGRALAFVPQHRKFYCYGCEAYAPRGDGPPPRPRRGGTMSPEDEAIGYAPFSREEMDLASKEQLMEWCRDYSLDDSGLKYELRLRLLEHIRRQNLLLKGETPAVEEPEETEVPEQADEGAMVVEEEAPPEPDVGALLEGVGVGPDVYEPPPGEAFCPTCGQPLTYVSEYDQWYCYHCQSYTRETAEALEGPPEASRRKARGKGRGGLAVAGLGLLMYVADQLFFHAPAIVPMPLTLPAFLMTPEVDWGLGLLSIVLIAGGLMAAVRRR